VTGWKSSGSLDGKSTPASKDVTLIVGPLDDRMRIVVDFTIGSVAKNGCQAFEPSNGLNPHP
jgi:hypothetical protein